jgi:hypothetical protein
MADSEKFDFGPPVSEDEFDFGPPVEDKPGKAMEWDVPFEKNVHTREGRALAKERMAKLGDSKAMVDEYMPSIQAVAGGGAGARVIGAGVKALQAGKAAQLIGKAQDFITNPIVTTSVGAYEGYKHGGISGAVTGAVTGGVLSKIGKKFGTRAPAAKQPGAPASAPKTPVEFEPGAPANIGLEGMPPPLPKKASVATNAERTAVIATDPVAAKQAENVATIAKQSPEQAAKLHKAYAGRSPAYRSAYAKGADTKEGFMQRVQEGMRKEELQGPADPDMPLGPGASAKLRTLEHLRKIEKFRRTNRNKLPQLPVKAPIAAE